MPVTEPMPVNNYDQPHEGETLPRLTRLLIDSDVLNSPLQPAAILIQAGHFTEAHHLLLELSSHASGDPNFWLLLAWTAPTAAAAIEYYRLCLNLDPNNDLAHLGIQAALVAHRQVADQGSFAGNPPNPSRNHLPEHPANQLPTPSTDQQSATSTTYVPDLSAEHLPDTSANHLSGPSLHNSPPIEVADRNQSYADFRRSRQAAFPSPLQRLAHLPFYQVILLYLLLLAVAESLSIFLNPLLGVSLHAILTVILFAQASLSRIRTRRSLLFSLALAPLLRLLSLSIPLTGFEFSYWYAIIGLPLLLSVFLVYRLTGYKPADIGLSTHQLPIQFIIGVVGFAIGWVEYRILNPSPIVQSYRIQDLLIVSVILIIFTGFLEELIYRGLIQRSSGDVLGKYGILYVSFLYAFLHIGNRPFPDFGFALFVGLTFALIVKRTGSIWGVSLAHGLANLTLYILMPS